LVSLQLLSLSSTHVSSPLSLFFFHPTATTAIYTLSLHDALPILPDGGLLLRRRPARGDPRAGAGAAQGRPDRQRQDPLGQQQGRSEEHTSELQSHLNLVCRLLLEKKKKNRKYDTKTNQINAKTYR